MVLGCGTCVAAGVSVPTGASLDLGGGQLDAAGGDLNIAGSLNLGTGKLINLKNLQLAAGGQAMLGSGQIALFGDWDNGGTINAGSSQVGFSDGGLATSTVLGSTSFASASFVSTTGKLYRFESGTTQIFEDGLTIQGTSSAPIQIDVTNPGTIAQFILLPTGSQAIQHVGVSDVHAIDTPGVGQHLAPDEQNQGGRGNATGWFASLVQAFGVPVPGPGTGSLLALLLLLGLLASRQIARRSTDASRLSH